MLEYPGMILGVLTLLVVQAICDLSLPDYMSDIVDNGVINGNVNYILQIGGKDDPDHVAQRGLHDRYRLFCLPDRRLYRPRYGARMFSKRVQTFSNP